MAILTKNEVCVGIDIFLVFLFFFYEGLCLIQMKGGYVDLYNVIDWMNLLLTMFCLFLILFDFGLPHNMVLSMKIVSCLVNYFRFLIYLAIIRTFTNVIKILIEMIKVLIPLTMISLVTAFFFAFLRYLVVKPDKLGL